MGFLKFDLDSIESYVSDHLKLFLSMAAGILVFVGIIAVSIFFIAVRGAEQTMVPEVRGKELTEALLELQVKELYPRIQLRYSQSSRDRGLVLEQEPKAGTIVKAGRRIRLVVSQGVIINRVENFTGRNIDDVRMDIQTLFASAGGGPALLSVREPLMYEYSAEAPGTILQQKPEAGTDISGPITLEFVVSQGQENAMIAVPRLTGLSVTEVLEQIGQTGIDFRFTIRETRENEKPETVVYQQPAADAVVPANTLVQIGVNSPESLADGEVYQLFRYTIPENPYPLSVRLEALLASGERIRLISVEYPGGEFTVPYKLPAGSTLILSMLNREIHREEVKPPAEELPLDQL
ncbi:MAG: PASTA domain-containing protein [Treponema sp.]|jgi:beta-lactam-binding protein with PASTA domain|nr:PASTA domain-containing protein [Treponema sp.]